MYGKKLLMPLLAGTMLFSLFAPVPAAAAANKAVEVPVNFTNTSWEEENGDASRTNVSLWGLGEPSAYSDGYTVSYKLYVPESIIKEGSAVQLNTSVDFSDAGKTEDSWAGHAECPYAEFHQDGSMTYWDEEKKEDIAADYATAKKSNGYWVISYKAKSGDLQLEDAPADASKASAVYVSYNLSVRGILITAKNKAVYLDDLKITKADGTVVYDQDFNSLQSLKDMGEVRVYPNLGDADGKELKLATLSGAATKTLKVAKTSLNIRVGKKATIKATAKPAAKISYTSSNKKVATVNSKGVVVGKKPGKATITVKANGKTVKVKVNVKK